MKKKGKIRDPLQEADPWAQLPEVLPDNIFREHLSSCNNTFDYWMAFIKHGKINKLRRKQLDWLWNRTSTFISGCERKHFKMFQPVDEHQTRMLAYYEYQKLMKHKSPKWCRYVFETAFADFLSVLQCRSFGIALPHGTCLLNSKTKFIKYWKYYFICKRNSLTIEEFIILYEKPVEVYPDVVREFKFYFTLVEQALQSVPGIVYYGVPDMENVVSKEDIW